MRHFPIGYASVFALAAAASAAAQAPTENFNRIASFPVALNLPAGADPATVTSAEIVAASGDGMTLVYTDSPNRAVGFIDITDPNAPAPLGSLAFDGEPTAVSILDRTAFVGVNTRASFTEPSAGSPRSIWRPAPRSAPATSAASPIRPRSPATAASWSSPSRTSATRR